MWPTCLFTLSPCFYSWGTFAYPINFSVVCFHAVEELTIYSCHRMRQARSPTMWPKLVWWMQITVFLIMLQLLLCRYHCTCSPHSITITHASDYLYIFCNGACLNISEPRWWYHTTPLGPSFSSMFVVYLKFLLFLLDNESSILINICWVCRLLRTQNIRR